MNIAKTFRLISNKYTILLLVFLLSGCGDTVINSNSKLEINTEGFSLNYEGGVQLEKILVQKSDSSDIVDLYQEAGDETSYKDSLIFAKGFNQGNGVNLFVAENLNILESQGLTIQNIKKTQIKINKNDTKYDAVLAEYEIVDGFVEQVPHLYVSQLFIDYGNDYLIYSYITESSSQSSTVSKMFQNIK